MAEAACTNCGAPLEGPRYEVTTKCKHCGTAQDNPAVLVANDEVMRPFGEWYELGTVRACRGPKAIDVEFAEKPDIQTNLDFTTLVPVVRATGDLKRNTVIFHRDLMGWVKTWTGSDAAHGSVKAKNPGSAFQDPFFDKQADLAAIRVPAIASAGGRRSLFEDYVERFKNDPIGAVVKLVIAGVGLAIVSFIVWFVFEALR